MNSLTCIRCKERFGIVLELKEIDASKVDENTNVPCPRCGSDNFIWLRLIKLSIPLESEREHILDGIRFWFFNYPRMFSGILIGVIFVAFALFIAKFHSVLLVSQAVLLSIVILFVSTVPVLYLPFYWLKLREEWLMKRYLLQFNSRVNYENMLWFKWLSIFFVTSLVCPLAFYRYLPFFVYPFPLHLINPIILWILMVCLAGTFSMHITINMLRNYVELINKELPLPIFCSLADLIRISLWEVQWSIGRDISHVRWHSAYRNEIGGIDLIGDSKNLLNTDARGQLTSSNIIVRQYVIKTDAWGRISWSRIPAENSAISNKPYEQDKKNEEGDFKNQNTEIPGFDSLKLHYIARLRNLIFKHFNKSELKDLCFDLGVNYDELQNSESTKDAARELVAYLDRRNRLSDLVARCYQLRPKVKWEDGFSNEQEYFDGF